MQTQVLNTGQPGQLLEEIWKRSTLMYLSDLIYAGNDRRIRQAVGEIPRDCFSPEQWGKAYEYLFRESGAGKTKDDILRGLKGGRFV